MGIRGVYLGNSCDDKLQVNNIYLNWKLIHLISFNFIHNIFFFIKMVLDNYYMILISWISKKELRFRVFQIQST